MLHRIYLPLALAACAALSGCGGGNEQRAKYKIAVIPKGLTHEFWQSVHRGAEQAGKDLTAKGVSTEVIWDGPRKEDDAQNQIEIIQLNLSNNVNGLVLAPQHSKTMIAPVERAVDQGVPVVVIDSGLNNQEKIVKYIATNNYHGGELAAEQLLKVLRDEGKPAPKVILLRYNPGSESTEQREKGFVDVVNKEIDRQKKAGEPAITWLSDDQYAGATKDSALERAMPLLNSFRDQGIDGIFAPNESSAAGMLQALRTQGLNKKVHFVGFDSSGPLLQALEEGDIDGLVVQDPYKMGYLGVWTLVQYLEGFDVAEPPSQEHPDGKYQSTGEHLITKANLKEKGTRELFEPDSQKARSLEPPAFARKR